MRCDRADKFESYVDDPTTLDAVRALHDPPDVVVEVKQGPKESFGNATCGHSPICIIVLPAVIEDLAFPLHYQNATVKKHGKPSYEAVFRDNGEFFRASARDATIVREIQFLALARLDRNVVVEVGRAPLDAHGKPGKFQKTSVQGQVDLLTPYTKLLSDLAAPDRAMTLLELTRVLGDDAFPLLQARLGDPKEPDAVKLTYFYQLCGAGPAVFEKPGRASELMRAFAAAHPPVPTALAALNCCQTAPGSTQAALSVPLSEARPLVEATLRGLGEASTTEEFLSQTKQLYLWAGSPKRNDPNDAKATRSLIHAALEACRPVARRSYLAFLFDAPLSLDDRRALAKNPDFAAAVHSELDPNVDADYALLLYALAENDAKNVTAAFVTLYGRATPPTQAERARLRELYTEVQDNNARAHILGRLTQGSPPERSETAAWFRARFARPATGAPVEPAAPSTTGASEGYLPDRPSEQVLIRHATLAALGSSEDQLPVLRYLARYAVCAAAAKNPPPAASAVPAPSSSASASPGSPAEPERAATCGFEPVTLVDQPKYVSSLTEFAQYELALAGCDTLYHDRVQRAFDGQGGVCR